MLKPCGTPDHQESHRRTHIGDCVVGPVDAPTLPVVALTCNLFLLYLLRSAIGLGGVRGCVHYAARGRKLGRV